MDLYKICEDLIHDKVEIKDVINKYEINCFRLIDFIKRYCSHYKISIDEDIKEKLDTPLIEMLELRKQRMSYEELSKIYNCSSMTIKTKLIEFCKKNNYSLPEKDIDLLSMQEMYELKDQGMSYKKLSKIYNYSSSTIRTKLIEFCKENDYPIPEKPPRSKSIELPMKEVYELKKQGVSYRIIASMYGASPEAIRTKLIEFCEENDYPIPKKASRPKLIELPVKEIYELKKQDITYNALANKYGCSSTTIRKRLIEYEKERILKNKYLEILLYDFNLIQEDILNRKIGLFYEDRGKDQEESIALTKK